MWLELISWICNVLIFHQHILLIACEPSLNLITNYLICVAGKQWEALRFTIEVCTCMVLCLIAHYCAIAGTILIFRFLTNGLAHVGPAVRGVDPLFDPFCIWGNELSMNISQVKKLRKIVRIKKLVRPKMSRMCLFFVVIVWSILHMWKWVVHEYQSSQETQKDYYNKEICDKNNKIFVCTMKKTSVHYGMLLTIIPCLFYSFAPFPI